MGLAHVESRSTWLATSKVSRAHEARCVVVCENRRACTVRRAGWPGASKVGRPMKALASERCGREMSVWFTQEFHPRQIHLFPLKINTIGWTKIVAKVKKEFEFDSQYGFFLLKNNSLQKIILEQE